VVILSVIYPRGEGANFDFDHYAQTHLPLLTEKLGPLGLTGAYALRGAAAADGGEAPHFAMAFLNFGSAEALGAAMSSPEAAEVVADIANFTNVRPMMQVNEHIS
jgi:uncharacterized protein (TIGR02118 family)